MVDQVESQSGQAGDRRRAGLRIITQPRMRGPAFVAGIAAVVVLLWAGTVATILQERSALEDAALRSGMTGAQAAVDGAAALFSQAEAAMAEISLRAGDDRDPDWAALLGRGAARLPEGLAFLAAYKTNGRLIHRTDISGGHRETIATLEHFRTPLDRGLEGLHIGRPYQDSLDGRTVIPLVRLHPGPGRALRAILVAGFDAEALAARTAGLPGAPMLARSDGVILAMAHAPAGAGAQVPLRRLQDSGAMAAGNGMPILAAPTARSEGLAVPQTRAGQMIASALIATIGLCAFGLFWRLPKVKAAPRSSGRQECRDVTRAKSVLLATMSHEFRTPLNAVIGFAEVIRDQARDLPAEKLSDYAGDIADGGRQLLQMVNDILDLSQIESGDYEICPQRLDLAAAVAAVNRIVAPLAGERGVVLAAPAVAQDLELVADRRALKQILYNLVHNGVKFTGSGGTVSVTAVTESAGTIRIDVIDNGIGIAAEDLDRIMRPFEQSRDILTSTSSGTGLGLALVGRLTGLHGGAVDVQSAEREGTIVSVRLPSGGQGGSPMHGR